MGFPTYIIKRQKHLLILSSSQSVEFLDWMDMHFEMLPPPNQVLLIYGQIHSPGEI